MDKQTDELIMVSIRCITYNHEPYIRQCLEGFVMQKTNFRFEAIVHDDASTDHTAEIIREYAEKYPDIIKPIFETENQWKKGDNAISRIMAEACIGKYVALCEGDDYWIDENKLQRQIDFLESQPNYSASTENGMVLFTHTGIKKQFSHKPIGDVSFNDLLINRQFPTASVVYRNIFTPDYTNLKGRHFDTLLWTYLSTKGKIHYNPIVSSVYRRGSGVTENNKIQWADLCYSFNKALFKNFNVPTYIKKIRIDDVLLNYYYAYCEARKKKQNKDAFRVVWKSFRIKPFYLTNQLLAVKYSKKIQRHRENAIYNYYDKKLVPLFKCISNKHSIPVIVSLTSFPARFSKLHITLNSLLNQTCKPSKIILYLDKTVNIESLPQKILTMRRCGLEIKNTCEDVKSHKKYLYAMREYPNAIIITVDDDLIYPKDMVTSLINNYRQHPHCISARRTHLMLKDKNNKILPYNQWVLEYTKESKPSHKLFATTGGGTLFPPKIFDVKALWFTEEYIKKYCLNADDVWLKFIEIKNNVKVSYVNNKQTYYATENANIMPLYEDNLMNNKNDEYIQSCESLFNVNLCDYSDFESLFN